MSANLNKFEQHAFDQNLMKEIFEKYLWKFLRKTDNAYHRMNPSWAQQGEDLVIDFIFKNYLNIQNPTWLDIGTNHPSSLSNTYMFYKRGCMGVNIEADPLLFNEIKRKRKRDINLNIGIGLARTDLDFYRMSASTLNTFSKEKAEVYTKSDVLGNPAILNTIKIPVFPVNEILSKYFAGKNNYFMSIDVEGWDFDILTSINFEMYKPPVICIETNDLFDNLSEKYIAYMNSVGYIQYAHNSINSIFLKKDILQNIHRHA